MTFVRRTWLAEMAALERDSRAMHYPKMIAAGEIERGEADADLTAWSAIAELFDTGHSESGHGWAELEHAASRALIRRSAACDAAPGDEEARDRRDAVQAIHQRLEERRRTFAPLRDLYEAAAREKAA